MTEKRFRVSKVFELNNPFPIYDRDCPLTQKEASDLLNELADENEQLKESVWSWSKSYNRVYEDKERILNTIKHAYYNERTQLGKSVLKQLLEAIQ